MSTIFPSLVILGLGLVCEEHMGMLVSKNLGMLEVSTPRLFALTFVLGRGLVNIECLDM